MKQSLLVAATIIFHGALNTLAFSDLFCSNDSSFRFTYKGETRDCQWIVPQSDEVTKTLCRDMTIRTNCLHSCGLCCEDNIFYRIQTLDGQYKTCSWIAQDDATKLQYCNLKQNGIFLREVCAATCNNCEPFIPLTEEPSGAPTAPPTIPSPPPTAAPSRAKTERPSAVHLLEPCTDNPHFVFVLQNGVQQNCAWIQSNSKKVQDRQEKYCPDQDIFDNCQEACEACVENNNSNNNNHTHTATTTAAPSKNTMVTFAPTLRPSSPQPNVPSPSPTTQSRTTSPTIKHATPSNHPSQTHNYNNSDNNNGSNQEEESFPSETNTDHEPRGFNSGEETNKNNNNNNKNNNKSGSTAAWVLSFMGVFFIIGVVVRIVGKKKENNVTKTQVTKNKRGAEPDQGSSWIVTFLSGSLCSDISYDDDDE
jgi:hypothetical protein